LQISLDGLHLSQLDSKKRFAVALLYLVTEELLMEAHEVEEKPISTLVLFGGFLAFWCIQLMGQ
jgi:zinc transporter ZupT